MRFTEIQILFDIDGTLLRLRDGTGFSSFSEAFRCVFPDLNIPPIVDMPQTDFELLAKLLPKENYYTSIPIFYKKYAEIMFQKLLLQKPILCKNVYNLLNYLKDCKIEMLLFTGNAELPAQKKITTADIGHFFQKGLYGDYTTDKAELLIKESSLHTGKKRIIVTDSVTDILSAKKKEIPVLAVATGWTPFDELKKHKPDAVIHYFPENPQEFIKLLEIVFKDKFAEIKLGKKSY